MSIVKYSQNEVMLFFCHKQKDGKDRIRKHEVIKMT